MKLAWQISEENGTKTAYIDLREISVKIVNYIDYIEGPIPDRYQYHIYAFGALRECEGCPEEYKTIEQACEYVERQVVDFIKGEMIRWRHHLYDWEGK